MLWPTFLIQVVPTDVSLISLDGAFKLIFAHTSIALHKLVSTIFFINLQPDKRIAICFDISSLDLQERATFGPIYMHVHTKQDQRPSKDAHIYQISITSN